MSESKVSVVIPTRNRWRLLRTTVTAALAQEAVGLELIVVDDGSEDGTSDSLKAIGDPRLRVCRNEVSQGVAPARNRGIAEARSEWVAFLDDDDIWAPAKLRRQLDVLRELSADFAYTGAIQVDEEWRPLRAQRAPDPAALPAKLRTGNAIPAGSSNAMVRTSVIRDLGGFDEELFHLADWDLWIRLTAAARGAAVPEFLVAYVKHPRNMLTEADRDLFRELSYVCDKHGIDVRAPGARLSNWAGRGHLESGRRRDAARTYVRGARDYRCAKHLLRAGRALVWPGATGGPRPSAPQVPKPDWLESYRASAASA